MFEPSHLQQSSFSLEVQHTLNHENCPACGGLRSMSYASIDPAFPFCLAADLWLKQHSQEIKPSTTVTYAKNLKPLKAFFQQVPLIGIHIGTVRSYQNERRQQVCRALLNAEVNVLAMILREAGIWDEEIEPSYRPLKVQKRRGGHSLSSEDEQKLRDIAFSRPKWRLAAHCMIVMLSTTMGFGEMRHLRRRDIDLRARCLTVVDGAKNDYRDRTIPLNNAAYDSICWLIERWEGLGGADGKHFLLPHRARQPKGPWLLDEPMASINNAFRNIRKEAGLPHFRLYDCRVQAITKLLSNPKVSPQVAKEIAGHISQAMQDRYSIQQHDTKLAALEALEGPGRLGPQSEPAPNLRIVGRK